MTTRSTKTDLEGLQLEPCTVITNNHNNNMWNILLKGARCSSVVRAFAHGAIGRRIDPSWWTY